MKKVIVVLITKGKTLIQNEEHLNLSDDSMMLVLHAILLIGYIHESQHLQNKSFFS